MPVASGALATQVNLNDSTPAAPAGAENVKWQGGTPYTDPNNGKLVADVSACFPHIGGVAVKAADYTAVAADDGLLLVFDSASAVALTLPNPVPTTPVGNPWRIFVANIGAGLLTINPNALDLDGSTSSPTLGTNAGMYISTDGANYFSVRGGAGGGSDTDTLAGATDVAITSPADGDQLTYVGAASKWENTRAPYDLWLFFSGQPSAGFVLLRNNFTRAVTFPSGLSGSQAICQVAPSGSVTLQINKNGVSIGTVNFAAGATTGTFTFSSSVTFAAGDRLTITAPSPQDGTFATVGITLKGTR